MNCVLLQCNTDFLFALQRMHVDRHKFQPYLNMFNKYALVSNFVSRCHKDIFSTVTNLKVLKTKGSDLQVSSSYLLLAAKPHLIHSSVKMKVISSHEKVSHTHSINPLCFLREIDPLCFALLYLL